MTDKAPKRTPKREVWHPVAYDIKDIRAVQALATYASLPDEQKSKDLAPAPSEVKRALDWIIYGACQKEEIPFRPTDEGSKIADFVMGRQSVAQQLIKLMKLNPALFEGEVTRHDK